MFTGIIEEIGKISNINKKGKAASLEIKCNKVTENTIVGDSIAVDGICLTVTTITPYGFTSDIMPETISKSVLATARVGDDVNLERAMLAGGRFGGHIVSGHIDGIGKISKIAQDDGAVWYEISCETYLTKFIVEKGSIAIDGISLTVAKSNSDNFKVSIIPHTHSETTLSNKKVGDYVNLENDCVGKYIERLMKFNNTEESHIEYKNELTLDFLHKNGF